jgi:hypothetical protein
MLAAEMVGPEGHVIGADRAPEAVERAWWGQPGGWREGVGDRISAGLLREPPALDSVHRVGSVERSPALLSGRLEP